MGCLSCFGGSSSGSAVKYEVPKTQLSASQQQDSAPSSSLPTATAGEPEGPKVVQVSEQPTGQGVSGDTQTATASVSGTDSGQKQPSHQLTSSADAAEHLDTLPPLANTNTATRSAAHDGDNLPLHKPEDLISDIQHLVCIGQGAYSTVYKGIWHTAPVAVKFVASESINANSASLKEALLSQGLSHPYVIQTYAVRCAQIDMGFITRTFEEANLGMNTTSSAQPPRDFKSGEGFGDPYELNGTGKEEKVVGWPQILTNAHCKPGSYLTVIIMEYCNKGSLTDIISKGIFLNRSSKEMERTCLRAIIRTAREIAQGMSHLHACNIVHGDLKPCNVLVKGSRADRRGFSVKVSDFGLSKSITSALMVDTSKWGTLSFMAPEHFSGQIGRPADVYSFGVLLWQMYSAKKPYQHLIQGEIVVGVQSGRLRPKWPEGAPQSLIDLSERCWTQNPGARPSFVEVIDELNRIESGIRLQLLPDAASPKGAE